MTDVLPEPRLPRHLRVGRAGADGGPADPDGAGLSREAAGPDVGALGRDPAHPDLADAVAETAHLDAADVAGRLRAGRRALEGAAVAYTAAHGHPLSHSEVGAGARRWRWVLAPRLVATAGLALAVVVGAVLLRTAPLPEPVDAAGDTMSATGAEGGGLGPEDLIVWDDPAEPDPAAAPAVPLPGADGPAPTVMIHVVGQVAEPGLVELPADARVADALEAAGGPTADADLTAVNLARPLVDGEQVYVPEPGEAPPAGTAPAADGPAGSGAVGAPAGSALVDLNTAGVEELQTLPGIGPVLAQRIVEWRTTNGAFMSVDELVSVSGIGPKLLAGLRDQVRV